MGWMEEGTPPNTPTQLSMVWYGISYFTWEALSHEAEATLAAGIPREAPWMW